jgi:hypothetical protein
MIMQILMAVAGGFIGILIPEFILVLSTRTAFTRVPVTQNVLMGIAGAVIGCFIAS